MAKRPNMRAMQMQDTIDRQAAQIIRYRNALEILVTAIHHDKSRNACWLAGTAIHVQAIYDALMTGPARSANKNIPAK